MSQPILTLSNVTFEYSTRLPFFGLSYRKALEDVSFHLHGGETLGVIGGNGSGKSTLLRLLANIYRPSRGEIIRRCDRVMLLSLGLGFDPELSGRDNALLSGVFLGGSRRYVQTRLADIIAFAELEERIDAPLKTYSSGMRARLGFAVGVMMEADLLLIDEVLSVGDARFREKAEKAMTERIASQQTIVLASHSLAQVTKLADRVVWLDEGKVAGIGRASEVIAAYKQNNQNNLQRI
jgi:lipopolysaccharide transport system ATP-binding protein